jgi:hypothetical protein
MEAFSNFWNKKEKIFEAYKSASRIFRPILRADYYL